MKSLQHTIYNLYNNSKLVHDIRKTKHISVFDIDGTLTGGSKDALYEVRKRAERNGSVVFSTARTPELTWSSSVYEASRNNGFNRPVPHVSKNELGKRYFKPLELIEEFDGLLDPDAVISLGTGMWIRTDEGYTEDKSFQALLSKIPQWRESTLELLQYIDQGDVIKYLAKVENKMMYETRDIDVLTLPFRIQLDLPSLELKLEIVERIFAVADSFHILADIARNVDMVDESNPKNGRYTLYLMPYAAPKEVSLNHLLKNISLVSEIPLSDISLLLAGDTLTDFKAGCIGGVDTQGTFILAGGSRLAALFDGSYPMYFAGVSLEWLWESLRETEKPGYYLFHENDKPPRIVVVGDIAYPNTIGPETILEYMKEHSFGDFE
ncbi:hypothetical protein H0W32_00610 [Patescibacteria group bacterium]|nr:hypothetical protein [Patescibacteria group bacterium]